jgi:hypothetical protein
MNNDALLLVNLAKARRERLKQLLLTAYRKAYPKQIRDGEPLPPKNLEYIVQNKMHLEMQYITNIYSIINNFMNYVCDPTYMENEINDLFKKLVKQIDKFLGERNYKYGISGSNAWYNFFGDIAPALSDYELSAMNKYNTKEYIYVVRNTSEERLLLFKVAMIDALKKIADYLNMYVQKSLGELIDSDEFSYFRGKEIFVGVQPYTNKKMLLDNTFSFSINLYIAKPDTVIPENEIIVDRNFSNDVILYNQFVNEYTKLNENVKRRKGIYYTPKKTFQLSSYIGKYKIMQKRYIDNYFRFVYDPIPGGIQQIEVEPEQPKVERKKRKTREEEMEEEKEEKYAKALNIELQRKGRAARAMLRELARRDGPTITTIKDENEITTGVSDMMTGGRKHKKNLKNKQKKGGEPDDDKTNFIKIKLFTFSFNYFNKIINPGMTIIETELEEKETILFDNFDKLLAIKEENKEQYFGLEGLYILNKIMQQKIFIQRNRYNPYKIRSFIFDKYIFSEYDPQSVKKIEKMWYITDLFEKTFKKQNIVKEFVYDNMKKDILDLDQNLNEFKEMIESNVIEVLRPYINKTILNINDQLSTMEFNMVDADKSETEKSRGDDKLTGVFILGGDALRRYKYDATQTKDIDAKIYIPMKIPYSDNDRVNVDSGYQNEEKIFRCITTNLIKLLTYLENNKKTLFEGLQKPEIIHKEILGGGDDNKVIIDVSFITEDPKMVNFKFRKSGKPYFPADLYSIDYKCIFKLTLKDKVINVPLNIAFIDIVVKQEGRRMYNNFSVFAENNLPLAKLEFLLSDLLHTYNENDLSLLRFFAGKSDKDYGRLKLLWNLYFQQKSETPIYSIDTQNVISFTSEANKQINQKLNSIADYTINESSDKLYISIMQIINELIQARKINNIKQFGDYENPNLFDIVQPAPATDPSLPVTGGRFENYEQQLLTYDDAKIRSSKKYNKYVSLPLKVDEKVNIDYRYNENALTKDLISLMNLSFREMEQKIAFVDDKDIETYGNLQNFNNKFYSEFAEILKPQYRLKNDNVMELPFITRLVRNIKRLDENTDIFFGKKKMSEKLSSKINKTLDEEEKEDYN